MFVLHKLHNCSALERIDAEKLCFVMQELQIFLMLARSIVFKHSAHVRSSALDVEQDEFVWNLLKRNLQFSVAN